MVHLIYWTFLVTSLIHIRVLLNTSGHVEYILLIYYWNFWLIHLINFDYIICWRSFELSGHHELTDPMCLGIFSRSALSFVYSFSLVVDQDIGMLSSFRKKYLHCSSEICCKWQMVWPKLLIYALFENLLLPWSYFLMFCQVIQKLLFSMEKFHRSFFFFFSLYKDIKALQIYICSYLK